MLSSPKKKSFVKQIIITLLLLHSLLFAQEDNTSEVQGNSYFIFNLTQSTHASIDPPNYLSIGFNTHVGDKEMAQFFFQAELFYLNTDQEGEDLDKNSYTGFTASIGTSLKSFISPYAQLGVSVGTNDLCDDNDDRSDYSARKDACEDDIFIGLMPEIGLKLESEYLLLKVYYKQMIMSSGIEDYNTQGFTVGIHF